MYKSYVIMWDIGIQCSGLGCVKISIEIFYFLEIIKMYFLLSLRYMADLGGCLSIYDFYK